MGLAAFALRRVQVSLLTLVLVSMLVFSVSQVLPGDVVRAVLGDFAAPEQVEAVRQQLGLDQPVVVQYLHWAAKAVTGDLGTSLLTGRPIADLVGPNLLNSLSLVAVSACIAIPLSIVLALACAVRSGGLLDRFVQVVALALNALPEFVKGLVLVIVFATTVFHLLPAVAMLPPGESPLAYPKQIALPASVLVLSALPYLIGLLRASMIEVLETDYVLAARLKGLPAWSVLVRHALPNAVVPTVQAAALVCSFMLGSVVVTEYIFRYPGIGITLTEAIASRDVPLVQAIIMVFAALYMAMNLVADLVTLSLTPQVRRT